MSRLGVLLVFTLVACAADEQNAATVTDSAGVRVVTNAAPDSSAPTFRFSAKPLASIGVIEGAPEYRLFQARGAVLRDGTILVVNAGTQEARFYDEAGKYLRSLGKAGQGPGEFTHIGLIGQLAGDSLLFFDGGQARWQLFTFAGEFVRTISSKDLSLGFLPSDVGLLSNRRVLVRQVPLPTFPVPPGILRRPVTVVWMGLDGTISPFSVFPGNETFFKSNQGSLVFGRGLHVFGRGDRIAVGNDDAYSIRIYDAAGKLLQIVREPRGAVPVKAGEFEALIPPEFRPGAVVSGPLAISIQRNLAEQPRLTTKPPWGGDCVITCLRIDHAGNLWVQEYVAYQRGGAEVSTWHVFNPEGVFTGALVVPPKTLILDAGADWVLVHQRDEFDVEHVVLYGLERP